jgi:hypothetical protein
MKVPKKIKGHVVATGDTPMHSLVALTRTQGVVRSRGFDDSQMVASLLTYSIIEELLSSI